MYLVDTNVWLEVLLEQERADEARQFLLGVDASEFTISEFSLYSIGITVCGIGRDDLFRDFASDTLEGSGVPRVCLDLDDLRQLLEARRRFRLDFDDSYQYVAAEKVDATIVSFDEDFDRTPRGRKTPAEALAEARERAGRQG
ncbi:MAG: PIN domain-containing protein [Planctomycetes bacterium]|nr:PIN domain-containing protein [Planctomycetota bacterium]